MRGGLQKLASVSVGACCLVVGLHLSTKCHRVCQVSSDMNIVAAPASISKNIAKKIVSEAMKNGGKSA